MTRTIHYMPHNEMRIEDIRRVLCNFVRCMPKAYRRRTRNAKVVMDIIQDGTGQAGYTSCVKVCEKIGCDPDGYKFPKWGLKEIGGRIEVMENDD